MKKLAASVALITLTLAAVAFSATAASAAGSNDPTLPAPGPGQSAISVYFHSSIYPCGTDQTISRVTIDQAIVQDINGKTYTVQHGRYVKDTSYTVTAYPKVYQCDVVYNAPPPELPLPSDFPPVWTGTGNQAPVAPAVAPVPAAQAPVAPAAAVTPKVASQTPATAPLAVTAPAVTWGWLRVLSNVF